MPLTTRRSLLLSCFAVAWVAGVRANADTGEDARKFVLDLTRQGIDLMANRTVADDQRREEFRRIFVSTFDLSAIGQFVLGRYWRGASPDQQKEFLQLFEDMQVLTWSKRFKGYQGEKVEVLSSNADGADAWRVDSRLNRPNSPVIPLQWRIHQTGGAWKVIDIVVDGASMALTQRQDYGSVIQESGGLDPMIATMKKKVDELRNAG
jgi:phospholipid transport system substrate-binding protein